LSKFRFIAFAAYEEISSRARRRAPALCLSRYTLNNNVYPPLRAAAAVAAIYVYLLFYLCVGLVVCVRVLCRFQTVCRPQFKTNPISRVILFSYCNKEMALFPRMLFGKGHSVFLSLLWEPKRYSARFIPQHKQNLLARASDAYSELASLLLLLRCTSAGLPAGMPNASQYHYQREANTFLSANKLSALIN
jgi:hypothetical protein